MFPDWLSSHRRRVPPAEPTSAPAAPPSDATNIPSLAAGVESLCTLCEELLTLIPACDLPDEAQSVLYALPEQIAAIRASAGDIKYQHALGSAGVTADDPYSLAALGQWVWRE